MRTENVTAVHMAPGAARPWRSRLMIAPEHGVTVSHRRHPFAEGGPWEVFESSRLEHRAAPSWSHPQRHRLWCGQTPSRAHVRRLVVATRRDPPGSTR